MSDGHAAVAIGQIWSDNDKRQRSKGRYLCINGISSDEKAICTVGFGDCKNHINWTGRVTKISLKRFKPTANGYRRVMV
jgi:hypothetical protein